MAADRSSLSSKRGNLRGLIRLARPLNLGIAASTLVLLKFGWLARWQPEVSVGLMPTPRREYDNPVSLQLMGERVRRCSG